MTNDKSQKETRRLRRPFQHGILGPLFGYDLVASTRRGQHLALRLLVAVVLLAGLYLLYTFRGFDPYDDLFTPSKRVTAKEMSSLAEGFAATCLIVQFALILLLTPPLVGEAIAREKERRTLDFLFVTELTDREIIIGKLGARLTYLFGVLLTSLPVLALTQLFGGVDPEALLVAYAVLLTTLLSLGSVSMLLSVWARTALEATLCSYFLSGCFLAACPCVLAPVASFDAGLLVMGVGVSINLLISVICITVAIRELRIRAVWLQPPRVPDSAVPRKPELAPLVRAAKDDADPDEPTLIVYVKGVPHWRRDRRRRQHQARERDWSPKPRVGERPLLWKELYFHAVTRDLAAAPREVLYALFGMIALLVGVIWLVIFADPTPAYAVSQTINHLVCFLTVALGGILGLGVIAHTAGSITRERERDTLIGLLAIPQARSEILEAKWLGAFLSLRSILIALVMVWLVGLLTGAVHPVSLLWLVLAVAAPLECLACLGIWLSVMNKTTLRANMCAALCVVMMACGPWLVMNYVEWLTPYQRRSIHLTDAITTALMPPVSWTQATVTWRGYDNVTDETRNAVLLGALAYAVLAWILWRTASWRFAHEKLGKR